MDLKERYWKIKAVKENWSVVNGMAGAISLLRRKERVDSKRIWAMGISEKHSIIFSIKVVRGG